MEQQASKPPRPTRYDVLAEAAEKLLEAVIRNDGVQPEESLRQRWREDLLEALEDAAGDLDGYRLARELDGRCWSIDASLVEVLDRADQFVSQIHTQRVEAWVEAHRPEQRFAVGDRVAWVDGLTGKRTLGRVVGVYPKTACYVVQDDAWTGSKACGWVLEYERVEAV